METIRYSIVLTKDSPKTPRLRAVREGTGGAVWLWCAEGKERPVAWAVPNPAVPIKMEINLHPTEIPFLIRYGLERHFTAATDYEREIGEEILQGSAPLLRKYFSLKPYAQRPLLTRRKRQRSVFAPA